MLWLVPGMGQLGVGQPWVGQAREGHPWGGPRGTGQLGDGQRGAALAYVLGLLAIFGLLTALVIRYTRFNDALVSRDRWDSQARLLAGSGLDYALSRIDPPGPALDLAYGSEGVDYRPENPDLAFRVRVATRGLLARAVSLGRTRLPGAGREKSRSALIGQGLDLGSLPALGLLNREGNMVLAGIAQVTGPVLLWRGGVRKATDYHVRWRGGAGHAGPVWDSTSSVWGKVEPDFRRADNWIKAQEALMAGGDPLADPDFDSGSVTDLFLGDSGYLADTALAGVRVRAGKVLTVGSGAILVDCKLMAPRIRIEGDAVLESVLAYASRNLDVSGGEIKGGQFAAMDSIRLSIDQALSGWPVFYVHGRMINRGKPDSAGLGSLRIEKATGEGIFLSSAREGALYDQDIRLHIGAGTSLTGLFYCNGFAEVEGRIKGSLLCRNLKFEYKGTIWLGHLKDARIEGFSGSKVVPAPLLFPGFPILAFGENLP